MWSVTEAKGMQKLFWLREHGPRMVLPHTCVQRSHFCAMVRQNSDARKHHWSLAQRADCGKAREGHTTRCFTTCERQVMTMADEKILMVMVAVTDMAKDKE